MAQAAPVFVHGCWRSASTWFWAKLRGRPGLRCYYEPLHERFAWHTLEVIRSQRISPEGLRKAGHPPIERPYFAEFEDVLAAGDLGFDPDLPYERYLLRPEETDDPLERYLRLLIGQAAAAQERAVLCFVRSQMRALWMRSRFSGLHVAQLRNPRDQWRSFLGQGGAHS